jgi:hypothetical protein
VNLFSPRLPLKTAESHRSVKITVLLRSIGKSLEKNCFSRRQGLQLQIFKLLSPDFSFFRLKIAGI